MRIVLSRHAQERMAMRGAAEEEIRLTIEAGETFPAKHGRHGFRRNFPYAGEQPGRSFRTKQIEVYGVDDEQTFVMVTVIVKFF